MAVKSYPLSGAKGYVFQGASLRECLISLLGWIVLNPDASVLAITIAVGEQGEELTVFWE